MVVKIALKESLTPVALATFRFLIAGVLFTIILALSGITLFFSVQYTGIQLAGAAMAAILVCLLSPLLITVVTTRILGEYLNRKQSVGLIIAALGTLTVVTGGLLNFQSDRNYLTGTLILLFTPLLWTIYTVLGRRILHKYSPFLVVANVTVAGGLFLIPISVAEDSISGFLTLSPIAWLAVFFLSTKCSYRILHLVSRTQRCWSHCHKFISLR